MKAAIYARVSTKAQKEEGTSLESQVEACLKFAKEKGLEVRKEHIFTEDWPGTTLDRPILTKIRSIIRAKEVGALITYSTDRLARNPIHLAIVAEECEKHKVELTFVTELLDSSPEAQLIRYVKGYAAQVEREKILDRVTRGKKARALKGKLPMGGLGLYGYDYIPGNGDGKGVRKINEREAKVVNDIFHWLAKERLSTQSVCKRLVERGIPAPKGGQRWSTATVGRILRNPVYTGKTYAFKMRAIEPSDVNPDGKRYTKIRRELRPQEEWIELPRATPAIISEELFEAAQKQLKRNRELSPRNNKRHNYLLRGFVYCRQCGKKFYGEPEHYRYIYRCSSRRDLGLLRTCHNRSYDADWLDKEVWTRVKSILLKPELIIAELERRQSEESESDFLERDLETVKIKLANREKQKARVWRAFEIVGDEETFKRDIAVVNREIEDLRAEKSELERHIETRKQWKLDAESIKGFCQIARQNIQSFSFEEKRLALEALQIKVWINGEFIDVEGIIPIPEGEIVHQQSS